jgi:hypothetical protein
MENENSYVVNYDKKTLTINFEGETFNFDLNDGDIGDFWHTFTTKDGVIKDVNYCQDDETEQPNLSLYGVKANVKTKEFLIDTSDEIYVEKYTQVGNQYSYFY